MADVTIQRGETFSQEFQWLDDNDAPINITGWTAEIDIRAYPNSKTPLFEASTSDAISITGATGTVTLNLTPEQTEALSFIDAVFDVKIIDTSGNVVFFPQMTILAERTVTRDDS